MIVRVRPLQGATCILTQVKTNGLIGFAGNGAIIGTNHINNACYIIAWSCRALRPNHPGITLQGLAHIDAELLQCRIIVYIVARGKTSIRSIEIVKRLIHDLGPQVLRIDASPSGGRLRERLLCPLLWRLSPRKNIGGLLLRDLQWSMSGPLTGAQGYAFPFERGDIRCPRRAAARAGDCTWQSLKRPTNRSTAGTANTPDSGGRAYRFAARSRIRCRYPRARAQPPAEPAGQCRAGNPKRPSSGSSRTKRPERSGAAAEFQCAGRNRAFLLGALIERLPLRQDVGVTFAEGLSLSLSGRRADRCFGLRDIGPEHRHAPQRHASRDILTLG